MKFYATLSDTLFKEKSGNFSGTVLKIAVVSVAISLIICVLSWAILIGFRDNVLQKLFSFSGHIVIKKNSLNQSLEEPLFSKDSLLFLKNLNQYPFLQKSYPVLHQSAILKTENGIVGVVCKGVDATFDWKNFEENIIEGAPISYTDSISLDILISKTVAQQRKLHVGQQITVYFMKNPVRVRKLRIKGIYQSGLEEFDKLLIITDLRLLQKINSSKLIGSYEFFCDKIQNLELYKEQLQTKIDPQFGIYLITDKFPYMFDWLKMTEKNLYIFLSLIALVCCFNIISIFLIIILEKIPTIAILVAFGANRTQINQIFYFLSFRIALKGLIWGNGIAFVLCFLQYKYRLIPLNFDTYFISYVPIYLHALIFALFSLLFFFLVAVSSYLALRFSSKINPIQALHFKK